ncbi:MAG: hypothetical protein MUF13_07585, partial [Akkermansiaceae bacterium]|nr:hypothetical protein [Akkermansiaceae bacterium]
MLKPWRLHVGLLLILIGVLIWQGLRPGSGRQTASTAEATSPTSRKHSSPSGFSPDLQADVFSNFTAWKNQAPATPTERTRWIETGIEWAKARQDMLAR